MALPEPYALIRAYYGPDQRFPFQLLAYFVPSGSLDPGSNDAAADMAGSFSTNVSADLKAVLCGQFALFHVACALHISGVVYHGSDETNAGVGTHVGDPSPDFVAACIRKQTAHGGRSGMGRWFIAGVPEGATDENKLVTDAKTLYNNLGEALSTNLTSDIGTLNPAHASRKDGAFYVITDTSADTYLTRQGRRFLKAPF